MEALRVRYRGNGRITGLLTHADSPLGGASSNGWSWNGAGPDGAGAAGADTAVPSGTQSAPAGMAGTAGSGPPDAATLAEAIAVVKAAAAAAPDMLALAGYAEAAEFAGQVEEMSRTTEYLQILSAGAVDRTRAQAIAAAATAHASGRTWVTGWDNGTETHIETPAETDASWPHGAADPAPVGDASLNTAVAVSVPASPADDGCKNTAEFLRARLRISAAEAHRRISLAAAVLPRPGISGHIQPAERPELAAALAAGAVASRPATIITLALDRVRHHAAEDTTARMNTP